LVPGAACAIHSRSSVSLKQVEARRALVGAVGADGENGLSGHSRVT